MSSKQNFFVISFILNVSIKTALSNLIIMASGPRDAFDYVSPTLNAVFKTVYETGI